ncbi:MAG: hypothetical protein JSW34_02140 [Candidatus Zixiibacteriota bacterium]|nr:MAG: hypothetical protein JSW34_02140 [candidate division Zixibacteria bacterium]
MGVTNRIAAIICIIALTVAAQHVLSPRQAQSSEHLGNPHRDAICTDCHALRVDAGPNSAIPAGLRRECETCHTPDTDNLTGIPLNFHIAREKPCTACHCFHDASKIKAAGRSFLVRFDNSFQRGQCYSCHGLSEDITRLTPGHRQAAALFHGNSALLGRLSPSEACLVCHSGSTSIDLKDLAETRDRAPCFDEHGSHPVGVTVEPGKGESGNRIRRDLDRRIRLFGGRIECQTCHSLSADGTAALVKFSGRDDLCRGCHYLA